MVTTLAEALPAAEFLEQHSLVIDAPRQAVWRALESARWTDLTVTKVFMAARGLGLRRGASAARVLDGGPVRMVTSEPPRYAAGARVAQPWRVRPRLGPDIATLEELAAFGEPGWLKYGMDFTLDDLPAGRTRLVTSTLCEPTDAQARQGFARYWRLIRPFSGLIRTDLLHAIARRALRAGA